MERISIDQVVDEIAAQLHVSKEIEHDVLEEIRAHLEDAVADARSRGEDEVTALREAAEHFGVVEASAELQEIHASWESMQAIATVAIPVLFTLALRWLAFAPDGTALSWQQMFARPSFWVIAAGALLIPMVAFQRWRYALVGWGIFWLITVIFVVSPGVQRW